MPKYKALMGSIFSIKDKSHLVWEHAFVISALGRPRQEDPQEFKVSEFMLSLGYIASKTLSQNTWMPTARAHLSHNLKSDSSISIQVTYAALKEKSKVFFKQIQSKAEPNL